MTEFAALLQEADTRPLVGWDLSCDGRITTASTSWNFEQVVDEHAHLSPDMLDMGTGGGEWLSRLPFRPARTVATEGWPPNVQIARERLAPLGVELVEIEGAEDNALQEGDAGDARLPFDDAAFHLVVNRHESFVAAEVARILAPGGRFVTQQVASDFNAHAHQLLGLPPPAAPRWRLDTAAGQLERAGMAIVQGEEGAELLWFADVGALAWYLKHVPYVCPGFTIERFRDRLEHLHRTTREEGPLTMRQTLFWLDAVQSSAIASANMCANTAGQSQPVRR